ILTISAGGNVSNTTGYIGFDSNATGTATVDGQGSTWTNSGDLAVGYSGTGTLHIKNGAMVSNVIGIIGRDKDSIGTATVDGVGSTWTNSDDLIVATFG